MNDEHPRPDTGHPDVPDPARTPDMSVDNALSLREAADRAGVNERTLRRWITRGRLHAVKLGGQYRITVADLAQASDAPPEDVRAADIGGLSGGPDAGHGPDRTDMSEGPVPGQGTPDTTGATPVVDLSPLAELIERQGRELVEAREAATLWQARAMHLESQLQQITARAGEAPGSPESGRGDDEDVEDLSETAAQERGIWTRLRRWVAGA